MKTQQLGIEEMARHGATHRVIIKAEDLNGVGKGYGALAAVAAAALVGTVSIFGVLAAGNQVQFVQGFLKVPFTGPGITSLTLQIGYDLDAGTDKPAGFLAATSVLAINSPVIFFPVEIADADGTAAVGLLKQTRKVFGENNIVGALFTAVAANLSALLTGEVHLYFRLVDLTKV